MYNRRPAFSATPPPESVRNGQPLVTTYNADLHDEVWYMGHRWTVRGVRADGKLSIQRHTSQATLSGSIWPSKAKGIVQA